MTNVRIRILRILASKALAYLNMLQFFLDNIAGSRQLTKMERCENGTFVMRGMRTADIGEVKKIDLALNNGIGFSLSRRLLYLLVGSRMVFVAERKNEKEIVGVDLFYFNPRDRAENTIHEGFIGVLPPCQGKGLASKLRKYAIENLQRSKLSGISTRVSVSNIPSFRSAEKMGFRVIERYFDPDMGEERCYLIRYF